MNIKLTKIQNSKWNLFNAIDVGNIFPDCGISHHAEHSWLLAVQKENKKTEKSLRSFTIWSQDKCNVIPPPTKSNSEMYKY